MKINEKPEGEIKFTETAERKKVQGARANLPYYFSLFQLLRTVNSIGFLILKPDYCIFLF